MNWKFDPDQGLIVLPAEVHGPNGSAFFRLALDTGATSTVLSAGLLVVLGYDPALAAERIQVTTGSSVEYLPRVVVREVWVLSECRANFPVLCHTLPPSAGVDGLLGLDFLPEFTLTLDLRNGVLSLQK